MGSVGEVAYDIVSRDKTAAGLNSAGDRARQIGKIAGAAMTGIGVGMIALTDSAKKTNATIRQTALQLGVTTEEMRELTLATTNVTFPISEVTASFDLLTRAGMENKEEIAITATAFDTLGDAIGMSASQVTTIMVPAFNAFGISLADAGDYTDIFTHLTRNTTVELADFSSMVNYLAADLGTMDLSMQESVAVMEALADMGIQGSAATREFRTAVSQADGDTLKFYEALGLTEAQVAKYSAEIDNAEGMTQEYADAANTQYGTMDKLKHSISELTLKYGSMLEPLDALGPAMATLGPIMITFSMIQWGTVIPSLTATTSAIWASTVAFLASPLGWFVIGVAAVVGILVILEKKFGVVTKATEIVSEGIHGLVDWFKDKLAPGIEFVHDVTARFGDKLLFLLGPIGAVIWGLKKLHGILADNKEEAEEMAMSFDDLKAALSDAESGAGDAAMSMEEIIDVMKDLKPEIGDYEDLLKDAELASEDLAIAQKKIGAAKEEVDKLTSAYDELKRAVDTLNDASEDTEDQARAIEHAEWSALDAERTYNKAVEEHGANSEEAQRADLRLRDAQDRLEDAYKRQEILSSTIAAADTEKQRILSENNVTNLTEFEILLETKKTGYETALADEVMAREAHEIIITEIAAREADTQIKEWMDMKKEMEANPVKRQVITEYIETYGSTSPESYQYGGIIPGPVGEPVPIIAHGGERFLGMTPAESMANVSKSPIEVKVEATIYNYSDVEEMERMIAEATARGIHDAYGMR